MQKDVDAVVTELRRIRVAALETRNRLHTSMKLPSKRALTEVMEGISAALFPNRLGPAALTEAGIDYFVGHTLDVALRELTAQVELELRYQGSGPESGARAAAIVRELTLRLPGVRATLDTDLSAAYDGDPAATSPEEVLVCYPGIVAITHHRVAHPLAALGAPMTARIISEIAHSATGIDIHPGAVIGDHFFIDHGRASSSARPPSSAAACASTRP